MKKKFIQLLIDMNIISNKEDITNTLATFYLDTARDFVKYYVNKKDFEDMDYEENFETSILNIALYLYKSKVDGIDNIASKTQGNRSVSFRGFEIPESYFMNLPKYSNVYIYGEANMRNEGDKCCKKKKHCCI